MENSAPRQRVPVGWTVEDPGKAVSFRIEKSRGDTKLPEGRVVGNPRVQLAPTSEVLDRPQNRDTLSGLKPRASRVTPGYRSLFLACVQAAITPATKKVTYQPEARARVR